MIHLEDEELDDELDHLMLLMMGEYRKRKHKQRKKHRGSVFGHKVYNQNRDEHDKAVEQHTSRLLWNCIYGSV